MATPSSILAWAAAAAVAGLAIGLAFASWSQHGASMFLAMVESGLAWCF